MSLDTQKEKVIYSSMGGDPDFGELVELYVEEMPDRIAVLLEAFESGTQEELRRNAHQLKGAAGSYGFHDLTPPAIALEHAVREEKPAEEIEKSLQELVALCRLVRAGSPE